MEPSDLERPRRPEEVPTLRGFLRHGAFNLAGQALPLAAALIALPALVRTLGTPRLGLLSLAWVVVGYFSLMDLGLGRALTQRLAAAGDRGEQERAGLIWTVLGFLGLLGLGATGLLLALAGPLASWLSIPTELESEARRSFLALALALPFVLTSAGLRGALEARYRFGRLNAVRIPFAALSYLSPLAIAPFTTDLGAITLALTALRVLNWTALGVLCFLDYPELGGDWRPRGETLRSLLSFGGWMTLSNLVSPLMVTMDRFLIGFALGMAAVAYYATPYEAITKLWIFPAAIGGVAFPAFARSFGEAPATAERLFHRSNALVSGLLAPFSLALLVFAPELLGLWLGPEFMENSTLVLRLLAAGVWINSVAQISFAFLQAAGRPDLPAKLHLLELPIYLLLLAALITTTGIAGVAAAWVLRAWLDAFLLDRQSRRLLTTDRRSLELLGGMVVLAVVAVIGSQLWQELAPRVLLYLLLTASAATVALHRRGAPAGRLEAWLK